MRKKASITVFMSMVYLILLCFGLGLIEVYRLQAIYYGQDLINHTGIQNISADYMKGLFDEYGIFLHKGNPNQVKASLERTYESAYRPSRKNEFFIDYLYKKNDNIWENRLPKEYDYEWTPKDLDFQDILAMKEEARLFAKLRLPYLATANFLEQANLIKEIDKAKMWLNKKNSLVESLGEGELDLKILYHYLDGIGLKDTDAVFDENVLALNLCNISRQGQLRKVDRLNKNKDIPEKLKKQFISNQLNLEDSLDAYLSILVDKSKELEELFYHEDWPSYPPSPSKSAYENPEEFDQAYLDFIIEREEVLREIEEIKAGYEDNIENFMQDLREASQELDREIKNFQELETLFSLAIDNIDKILRVNEKNIEAIDQYLEELEGADLMISVKTSIKNDLNEMLRLYRPKNLVLDKEGVKQTNNLRQAGDLQYILSKLKADMASLRGLTEKLGLLESKCRGILRATLEKNKPINQDQYRIYSRGLGPFLSGASINEGEEGGLRASINSLIEENMDIDLYYPLSYRGLKIKDKYKKFDKYRSLNLKKLANDKEELGKKEIQTIYSPDIDIWSQKSLNSHQRPSIIIPSKMTSVQGSPRGQVGIEDFFKLTGAYIEGKARQVVLNEYYLMVFSDSSLKEDDSLAISAYDRKNHYLQAEIEYLINGDPDPQKNVVLVAGLILGVRTGLNAIHLASDPAKRQIIIEFATGLAGWWSLGVAVPVIAILLSIIWASLEASIDLYMLMKGERVPLIKTSASWYSSIEGGLEGVLKTVVDDAVKLSEEKSKELLENLEVSINDLSRGYSSQISNLIENETLEILGECKASLDNYDSLIKAGIEEELSRLIDAAEEGEKITGEGLMKIGIPEEVAKEISASIKVTVENKMKDHIKISYHDKLDIIREELDKTSKEVKKIISTNEEQINTYIEDELGQISGKLQEISKDKLNEGGEWINREIEEMFKESKKKIKEKREFLVLEGGQAKGLQGTKDLGLALEGPSLSYRDYLRIFMIVSPLSEDQVWLRALDLIDENTRKSLGDRNFSLVSSSRQFEIKFLGKYEPMFPSFPFMKAFNKDDQGLYNIESISSGGY